MLTGQDHWWTITYDNKKITEEIVRELKTKGLEWFSGVETIVKIISNNDKLPNDASPRAKLDIALLVMYDNKEKGSELFREYFNNIQSANS